MKSTPPATACGYHGKTSYGRGHLTPHTLDWAHQPALAKTYAGLPRIDLQGEDELPAREFFQVVGSTTSLPAHRELILDRQRLATLLRQTQTVTGRSLHGGQPFFYRSVASAGALYPFEIYLVVHAVRNLEPGVYHYDSLANQLTVLRQADVPVSPPANRAVAATIWLSGIFFRSAWKYRSRAYRYVLLDGGHLLENLRLALAALGQPFSMHLDFDDATMADLLGLDQAREVALAGVHLHAGQAASTQRQAHWPPAADGLPRASQVSGREVDYPLIAAIHHAGAEGASQLTAADPPMMVTRRQPSQWVDIEPPTGAMAVDYDRVLYARRSRRNFIPAAASPDAAAAFLLSLAKSINGPVVPPACRSAIVCGLLVGDGLPWGAGFYLFDGQRQRLGMVDAQATMEPMARACLDQMWLKHAALHLLFMTDLTVLDGTWGARGYRYAMTEAGRLGQQAYLAATAVGWGACGIGAIYDHEAARLLGLTDAAALLYLVGAGPVKSR